jgi:MFS family permease
MNKSQLWTKDFLLNSAVMFLLLFGYYQLMAIMAVHAMDSLDASPSEAGLVAGIFIVAALIARLFSGRFIEQVGRKNMLYLGLALYSLATVCYFGATNLLLLFLIRCVHGAGYGMASTAAMTAVASIIPPSRRGEGMGYFMLSVTLASAIGPSLGIYLYQHAGFSTILALGVILLGFSFLAAFFLKVVEAELTQEQLAHLKRFTWQNFFEAHVLPIAVIGFLVFFSYSSIISFFSAYTKSIDLMNAGSVFFIVYSVATLISRPITGRWFDAKGENVVMYPTFVIFAIGLVILSQAHHGMILLLAGVFLGIGFGTFASSGQAIAIKLVENHRIGVATSTFLAIAEMGIGIGPFLLGFLVPVIGFRGVYVSMAGVVMLAMCGYYFLHGRQVKHGNTF